MELKGKVYIGEDRQPYIHIYREGYWPTESIRVSLYDDNTVGASSTSKATWRKWAKENPEIKIV